MSKSRARFLSELLGTTGLVKKAKSALAGADEIIDLSTLPSIPNSKLTNSSITINSSATSLGGSVTLTTANVAENTNLYYTDARADARIAAADTGDLSEGSNLYYTNARADARVNLQTGSNLDLSSKDTGDLSEGSNLYYTNARADARIAAADTDDLSEGSSNLYYTDARADARVALVVDSAPSTLNTLNELAAALGDDANFSTTVTNSIATKLPLAGGTLTGNLAGTTATFTTALDASLTVVSSDATTGIGFTDPSSSGYIHYVGSANQFYTTRALSVNGYTLASGMEFQVNGDSNFAGTISSGHHSISTTGTGNGLFVNGGGNTGQIKVGDYTRITGATTSNSGAFSFNANHQGAQLNTWAPDYAGSTSAGMFVLRQDGGGQGSTSVWVKKHGTTTAAANLNTFTKVAQFHQDGYFSAPAGLRIGSTEVITSSGAITSGGNITAGNSGNINIPTASSGNANLSFDGTNFTIVSNSSSANLKLQTNSQDTITIAANGNLTQHRGTATFAGTITAASILAGDQNSTAGDVLLQGKYSTGATVNIGSERSSGGVFLGYGVQPSTTTQHEFLSSTGVTLTQSAYVAADTHRWWTASSGSAVTAGSQVTTMTQRMTILANGKVGIGTTTPQQRLAVVESANYSPPGLGNSGGHFGIFKEDSNVSGDYGIMWGVQNTGNVWQQVQRRDGTATAYSLLLQPSGGNVGIGTASPSSPLEINSDSTDAYSPGSFLDYPTITLKHPAGNGYYNGTRLTNNSGNYEWFYGATQTSGNEADFVFQGYDRSGGGYKEMLRIQDSGNVGIGTDSPNQNGGAGTFTWASPLQTIAGSRPTLFLNGSSVISTIRMWPRATDGTSTSVDDWHINAINEGSGGYLSFAPQGGAIAPKGLHIKNTGNVGIGVTAPTELLHIKNSSNSWNEYAKIRIGTETTDNYASEIGFHRGTSNDTDRGFFIDGGGSGTQHFKVLHTGNVGIGATTPQRKLTVTGAADSAGDNTGILSLTVGTGINTDSKMQFGIDSSHRGYIHVVKPGNNVMPLILNPTGSANGTVQIYGAGNTSGGNLKLGGHGADNVTRWSALMGTHYNDASESEGITLIGSYSDSSQNKIVIGGNMYEGNPATNIEFWTHTATTHAQGGSNQMFINNSVINIVSNSLQMAGSTVIDTNRNISAATVSSSGKLAVMSSSVHASYDLYNNGTTYFNGVTTIDARLNVVTAGAEGLVLAPDTGSTNNSARLFLNGSSGNWAIFNNSNILKFNHSATAGSTSGSMAASLTTAGLLTVVSLTESSSIRYKENLKPITNGLEVINKLEPVTYDRTDNDSKNEPGFIAEEVLKFLPNVVNHNEEGEVESIKYTKIIAYLVDAVQELSAEVEKLKNG